MTSLWARQAQALIWLRAMLTWRSFTSEGRWARASIGFVALAIAAAACVGLAVLIAAAAGELVQDPDELHRRGGPLAVFATWLAMALAGRLWFSIRSLGGAGPFLDPRKFLPFAVPARVVSGINFLAALLEPTWLFFYPPLLAIGLSVATLPGAPPAWALLVSEAITVFAVAGVLHLFGAFGTLLGARPGIQRAVMVLLGFSGFAAFQLTAARPERIGLAHLFAERQWQLIALTPPGWTAVLARALADGSALHAFTPALLLLSLGALSGYGAHRLSLREAQRPAMAERRTTSQRAPRAGWQLPFGPPALSALFEKELKTMLRVGWLQLVVVPAGFLLLRNAFVGGKAGSFSEQPLIIAAAYAHLGVLDVATNAFGRDRDAARGWFLWPVDRRLLLMAKNACAYLFSLLIFGLLCGVQLFAGRISPLQLAIGLLAHAATFPALVAFGNVASAMWPTPQKSAMLRRARAGGAIGARLSAVALLGACAWSPFALGHLLRLPVLVSYLGALVVACVGYFGLLSWHVSLFESRKEVLLRALAKDE